MAKLSLVREPRSAAACYGAVKPAPARANLRPGDALLLHRRLRRDEQNARVAEMRMLLRYLKASSALYGDEKAAVAPHG